MCISPINANVLCTNRLPHMLALVIYWNCSMFTRDDMNDCYTITSITNCLSGLSVLC
jgi:hypothetical protein